MSDGGSSDGADLVMVRRARGERLAVGKQFREKLKGKLFRAKERHRQRRAVR